MHSLRKTESIIQTIHDNKHSSISDYFQAKEVERIEREAAAMKRLGLEELPSSESENDLDDNNDDLELRESRQSKMRPMSSGGPLPNAGHTGFTPSLASQVAAAAGAVKSFGGNAAAGAADDYIYETDSDNGDNAA